MHGIIMGHVLFNIFINDLEMLECVLISFVNGTKWVENLNVRPSFIGT